VLLDPLERAGYVRREPNPKPAVIAAEIAEDLQAALDQFSQIASDLGSGEVTNNRRAGFRSNGNGGEGGIKIRCLNFANKHWQIVAFTTNATSHLRPLRRCILPVSMEK